MPTITESALAQTHYRIRIASAGSLEERLTDILWTSFSGIKEQSQIVKYPDPAVQRMRKTTSMRDMEDVTISTPYLPIAHDPIVRAWKNYKCQSFTLEVQPVLCGTTGSGNSESPLGTPFIMTDCKWASIMIAEANRESNTISNLVCVFSMYEWEKAAAAAESDVALFTT
jgi:hypothetical protein